MSAFLSNLDIIWAFVVDVMKSIYGIYTSAPLFVTLLAIWALDRVFGIFKLIKG